MGGTPEQQPTINFLGLFLLSLFSQMPKKFDNTKTQILEQEKVIKREEINSSSSQISPIQRNFCTPSSIQL